MLSELECGGRDDETRVLLDHLEMEDMITDYHQHPESAVPWPLHNHGTLLACLVFNVSNHINSLVPGRFQQNLWKIIFKLIFWLIAMISQAKLPSLDLSDDKSTLVQVMAWCCQATSHYLNQCWPRSLPPYGITRPQWVKCMDDVRLAQYITLGYLLVMRNALIQPDANHGQISIWKRI